ncbi:MAG TPA: biotin/lipoyl-binding protein, partial [Anaeromyxobacteraceae bacterium]|nr:biotin/lipoyl-binding protein [Anaeromyxobacteraceae bacterium]
MTPRSEPTPVAEPQAGLSSPAPSRRRPLVVALAAAAVALAAWGVHAWRAAGTESTDDAQVEAEVVAIAPRIPGQVLRVAVKEDQAVKKGDLIVELDPADLAARVALAEADLDAAVAQASVVEASARGGLSSARAGVSASSAGLAGAAAQV